MKKYILSAVCLVLALAVYLIFDGKFTNYQMAAVVFFELLFLGLGINALLPKKECHINCEGKKHLSKGTVTGVLVCVILMPITVLMGDFLPFERKHYLISLLLILEMTVPFLLAFEGRKPKTGEIVLISVMCGIAVMGRCVFYMLPQFKPTLAIVIIAGAVFGGETGFIVGAISAFVSNIFFGQGPWTPWQMLATGAVGLVSGIVFKSLNVKKSKLALSIFGGIATVVIYGGILNPASVVMYQPEVTWEAVATFYISGLPFDLVHAQSTVFFLWLVSAPILENLERVRKKYGLI